MKKPQLRTARHRSTRTERLRTDDKIVTADDRDGSAVARLLPLRAILRSSATTPPCHAEKRSQTINGQRFVVAPGWSPLGPEPVGEAAGKPTSILRPPRGRACAPTRRRVRRRFAWTTARPSPTPSAVSDDGMQPLEGLEEELELYGWDEQAGVGDQENCASCLGVGCDFDRPPTMLCRIAFETRLAASRSRRSGSPVVQAGSSATHSRARLGRELAAPLPRSLRGRLARDG